METLHLLPQQILQLSQPTSGLDRLSSFRLLPSPYILRAAGYQTFFDAKIIFQLWQKSWVLFYILGNYFQSNQEETGVVYRLYLPHLIRSSDLYIVASRVERIVLTKGGLPKQRRDNQSIPCILHYTRFHSDLPVRRGYSGIGIRSSESGGQSALRAGLRCPSL